MGIKTAKYLLSALLLLGSLTAFSFEHPRRHILPKSISSKRAAAAKRAKTYSGDKRQLVVLVSFRDLDFESENPQPLWEQIFNQENFSVSPYRGSVHDYFYDQSYGKFNLHFDLHTIKVDKEHAIYHSTREDDANAALLLLALADSLKNIVTDWAPYDWDEDGYIDQVLVLFAGYGQNDGGNSNTIWAHQASLTSYEYDPVTVSNNGKDYKIDHYGFFPEKGKTSASFGTLCHEFGHCMGLPDFYYGNNTSIVKEWDIMDYGNYNEKGYCPPCYSAHERMLLGWLDIKELTEPVSITDMPALNDEPVAYLIRNDNYENEYYILENRQKQGWDMSLPGNGLIIFHIDYDEDIWLYEVPNSYIYKRYSIIPANNMAQTFFSYGWAYPYSEKDSLTNNSSPASTLFHAAKDGTLLMSKPITNIRMNDGLASFDFMGGEQTAIQSQTFARPKDACYPWDARNLQSQIKEIYDLRGQQIPKEAMGTGIYIIRYANGQTKKVVRR